MPPSLKLQIFFSPEMHCIPYSIIAFFSNSHIVKEIRMTQKIEQFDMKTLCVIAPCTCTGKCIQMS